MTNAVLRMAGMEQCLEVTRTSRHDRSILAASLLRIAAAPPFGLILVNAEERRAGSSFVLLVDDECAGSPLSESSIASVTAVIGPAPGGATLNLSAEQDGARLELLLYALLIGSTLAWSMPIAVILLGSSDPASWDREHWLSPFGALLACSGGLAVSWLSILQVGRRLARELNRRGEGALLAIAAAADAALGPARRSAVLS